MPIDQMRFNVAFLILPALLSASVFAQSGVDALVGLGQASNARAQTIAAIRDDLASCVKADCPARPLFQARLNFMLKMDHIIRENTGTVETKPQIREPDTVYKPSASSIRNAIANHCRAMNDISSMPNLTADETKTARDVSENAKTAYAAKQQKCASEYDAAAIAANRKTAVAYCLKTNDYLTNRTAKQPYDLCMNQNDMLTALCTQEMRFREGFERRNSPRPGPSQFCLGPVPNSDAADFRAIKEAPAGAAPGLPAKFLEQPAVSDLVAPGPISIPEGTVLQTVFARSRFYAESISVLSVARDQLVARLQQSIQSGATVLVQAGVDLHLKGRLLGPGAEPNSVRVALSADYVEAADQRRIYFTSTEFVKTVTNNRLGPQTPGVAQGIENGEKMSFTVGPSQATSPSTAGPAPSTANPVVAPRNVAAPQNSAAPQNVPVRGVVRPPGSTSSAIQSAPVQSAPEAAPQLPAPKPPTAAANSQMGQLLQQYALLQRRAQTSRTAAGQLQQRLARQGLQLRSDIVAARARMEGQLQAAKEAIGQGNADQAEESLKEAEAALQSFEKSLGQ